MDAHKISSPELKIGSNLCDESTFYDKTDANVEFKSTDESMYVVSSHEVELWNFVVHFYFTYNFRSCKSKLWSDTLVGYKPLDESESDDNDGGDGSDQDDDAGDEKDTNMKSRWTHESMYVVSCHEVELWIFFCSFLFHI